MSSDPTNITSTKEDIVLMQVKDVFTSCCSSNQITSRCVHNALGLSSRTGGVEQEERILCIHGFWCDIFGMLLHLFVPPEISTVCPRNVRSRPLVDKDTVNVWTLFQSLVYDLLGADDFASTSTLVGSDDDFRVGVENSIGQ